MVGSAFGAGPLMGFILPLISGGELFRLELDPSFYGHILYGHVLAFIVFLRDAVLAQAQLRSNG